MAEPRIPLDSKGEKLFQQVAKALDDLIAATTGTALSVAQPRVIQAVDQLAKHRYSQIGVSEPLPTGKRFVHTTAEKSNN